MRVTLVFILFSTGCYFLQFEGNTQESADIVIQKGAHVSLSAIVPSVLHADQSFSSAYVHELQIQENAALYIGERITLHSKKIKLAPNAEIYSLGNSLVIKADSFQAGSTQGLGVIDTRYPDEFHNGASANDMTQIPAATENTQFNGGIHSKVAQPGLSGESGQDGNPGQNAGSLTLIVRDFQGGKFVLTGGNGGQGGSAGVGGCGGSGLNSGTRQGFDEFIDWPCGMYQHPNLADLLMGGRGGPGGRAGSGGDGGNAGNLIIQCESFRAVQEETCMTELSGGDGGLPGNPGFGGDGGSGGTVQSQMTHQLLQGTKGENGAMGQAGMRGRQGKDGKLQIMDKLYEEEFDHVEE